MAKWLKRFGIATGFVFCFAAGAVVWSFFSSRDAAPTNKYSQITEILSNRWYYADQLENMDESFLTYAVTGNSLEVNDPFTQYLSNDQASNLNLKLQGSNAGIGISYNNYDGNAVVDRVFINSPADKSGIQVGDMIVSVNGQPLDAENAQTLADIISENDKESIALQIDRNGEILDLEITPAVYDATVSVETEDNYGVVELSSFSHGSARDFNDALRRIKESGAENLIIDLRSNTGGTTDAAIGVASSLVGNGQVIYQEEYANGDVLQYASNSDLTPYQFDQILILQDRDTASSSEILIGALKDYLGDDVILVGQNTFGKGSVQERFVFEDGTTLKFTRALWLTPNGISIDKTGFEPDVYVEPLLPTFSYSGAVPVEADSVNEDARAFQILLSFLGYPANRTDNYFTVESSEALAQFQQDYGLEVSGIGDQESFELLMRKARQKASSMPDQELEAAIEVLASDPN